MLHPVSAQPSTAVGVIPLPSVFLIVDFPNGGETLNAGDTVAVRWSTSVQDGTLITSHEVRLFADGNLVKEVTGLPGTTQSYQLTLPNINTTRAVVSVAAINGIRVLAGDRSDNVFTIQGSSTGPVITAIDPPAMRAGATTRVTVNGMNLPANAGDYAVVNSTGQQAMGITLQLLSKSATAAVFDVMVASSVSPGQYRFVVGTASAPFDILASQAPDITSLAPGQIPPGATTPVVVRGVNLPISPLPYLVVNSAGQQINGYGIERTRGGPLPVTRSPSCPADPGRPAACRRPTGLASGSPHAPVRRGRAPGGAGGYGHALGERTSGRAAGGHEGDGRGRWKRPFEFPMLASCGARSRRPPRITPTVNVSLRFFIISFPLGEVPIEPILMSGTGT